MSEILPDFGTPIAIKRNRNFSLLTIYVMYKVMVYKYNGFHLVLNIACMGKSPVIDLTNTCKYYTNCSTYYI